jgi:hypothetical protein
MYFTNISLIFFLNHNDSTDTADRFRLPLNPLQVLSHLLLLQQESQESLSLTSTMFLRLSHRPLYYTIFTVCGHLGSDPDLPDTILKGDHPRTIVTKLDSSWLGGFREEDL